MKRFVIFSITLFILNGCLSYPGKYESYQNLTYPKAMAKEIYPNGTTGNAWGIASGYTVDDARNKAIRNCISYSRSKMCVIQMENNFNVLDIEVAQFKTDNPWIASNKNPQQNSQQVDWGRVAGVLGKDILDREKARTTPTPMKYMFDYEVVSGQDKICVYRSGSSKKSITISSISICPINVD